MSDRSHETEERLAPVIAGDVTESDDSVASRLESDPALAKRVGELRETARVVEAAAKWRDDVLAEIDSDETVPGLDRVTPTLLSEAGIDEAEPRVAPSEGGVVQREVSDDGASLEIEAGATEAPSLPSSRGTTPNPAIPREALAAAAVLLVLAGGWLLLHPWSRMPEPAGPAPTGEIRLNGTSPLQGVMPVGEVSRDALQFRWESSVSLPPAGPAAGPAAVPQPQQDL